MECSMSGSNVRHSVMSYFAIPQTVVYQVSLTMGSSRQEYWSSLPFNFPLIATALQPKVVRDVRIHIKC